MLKRILKVLTVIMAAAMLLTSCSTEGKAPDNGQDGNVLTGMWGGYQNFLDLAEERCPDIELKLNPYCGADGTNYGWAQMRADDIFDIFTTTQIFDKELAKERLVDLSGYDFINGLSTSVLDQVSIDGGIYLLPITRVVYGIYYNKTLMEENGWEVPTNYAELEALCAEIKAEGLTPGILATQVTGNTFSGVFNLAKTSWLTTVDGLNWEKDFLAGNATAAGMWESTMEYVQKYIDIGMYSTDPEDRPNGEMVEAYLGERKSVFVTMASTLKSTTLSNGDKIGMMPYIGEDGSKNIYMYNPSGYIGISKRLTEQGNEEKLENAIRLLELMFSAEGQATFISDSNPCAMSVLSSHSEPEDSILYDAHQAMVDGRAFHMTYAGWENVLADMGQAYKDWIRGENGMDGAACIASMDELQTRYLNELETTYFCESTANFTLEETAELVGKALGSTVGADAAIIPYSDFCKEDRTRLQHGITGKLYKERINRTVASTICPGSDGGYAILTMTGAQAKELAAAGFDIEGDGVTFPYVLVAKGGELQDDVTYRIFFLADSYTEETAQAYSASAEEGSVWAYVRDWLAEQKTVSPDGNPWE